MLYNYPELDVKFYFTSCLMATETFHCLLNSLQIPGSGTGRTDGRWDMGQAGQRPTPGAAIPGTATCSPPHSQHLRASWCPEALETCCLNSYLRHSASFGIAVQINLTTPATLGKGRPLAFINKNICLKVWGKQRKILQMWKWIYIFYMEKHS